MKFLWSFLIFSILLAAALFALLFTGPGNGILRPYIESKIAGETHLPAKLDTFVLRPDHFEIKLEIGEKTKMDAKGSINLFAKYINASYNIDIEDLSSLQKLMETKMRGPFKTAGTIKGDKYLLKIEGKSDIAKSETSYTVELKQFEPSGIIADIAHLQIDKLLYMLNQPIYAKGGIDISAKISNLDPDNLDGTIITKIKDGLIYPQPIKNDFNLSIPSDLTFKGEINTLLKGSKATSKIDFITPIALLTGKTFTYDTKKQSLFTDYRIEVPDLDKLYFLTNRHMKGNIVITGDVKANKEKMRATAHSNTLGGAIDAVFEDAVAKVSIKNIQTVALTDMLLYPHIFDSRANAKLDYNTLTQKGVLQAELLNGQILPNKMSFLLQQMANFDITKEVYERTRINSKIDKKRLVSDLYMKSRLTEIESKNGLIDLENQTIDTTLKIKIRSTMLPVILKGSLVSPNIKIEAKELLRSKAKEQIKKHLPKDLQKSPVGELFKGLF